jgi:hypothetical protein
MLLFFDFYNNNKNNKKIYKRNYNDNILINNINNQYNNKKDFMSFCQEMNKKLFGNK